MSWVSVCDPKNPDLGEFLIETEKSWRITATSEVGDETIVTIERECDGAKKHLFCTVEK